MSFTAFDILTWTIIYLQYFIVAKIVIRDKTFHLKEGIYVIAASLAMASGAVISVDILNSSVPMNAIALPLSCMVYFYKIKSYSFKKTLTLIFIPIFIIVVSDVFAMAVVSFFFPSFLPSFPNLPLLIGFSLHHFLQFVPYIVFTCILSALTTFLLVKATKKQRRLLTQSDKAQTALAGISLFVIFAIIIVASILHLLEAAIEFLVWNAISLSGIAAATLVSVVFYARSLKEKMTLEQKEAEQKILRQYTHQVEEQQTAMRKFKHDYQNILLSVEGFVSAKNWDGLEQYMPKVRAASTVIIKGEFALESLSKIKPPEIKGLLAAKLMLAQNIGIHVHTTFEAHEEIDHIPVDSVALVRMLGIILDNAIEELTALGAGQLMVACYKDGGAIIFAIANTCRTDIPKLRALKQVGYSSKGEGRGLGLSNLEELVAAHSDNLTLQTSIADGNFMQKLWIGGE